MAGDMLEVSSKSFSKVLFSGSGIAVDACLDRAGGIRIHEEQKHAMALLLEKTATTLFHLDVAEDTLYYAQVLVGGTRVERKIEHITDVLHRARDGEDPEGRRFAQALLEARGRKADGRIRYRGRIFTQSACWNQMDYRSLMDERGKVYAVVGSNVLLLDGQEAEPEEDASGMAQLYEGDQLVQRVDSQLRGLTAGEKGVMFLLSIRNFVQRVDVEPKLASFYLRAVVEAIRSDFRGKDILGRVREDVFLIFICGNTSIDIIERRAQRIIDLCQRVPLLDGQAPLCNVGVAASSSNRQQFGIMLGQAESALAAAKERGDNQYRLFEEEKY